MSTIWKVNIFCLFGPTKIPGYILAFKKASEALDGNLLKTKIHIYTIHSTLLCHWELINRGAGYGLEISLICTFRGLQKAIEWMTKTVECEIKLTNDMKKNCFKKIKYEI